VAAALRVPDAEAAGRLRYAVVGTGVRGVNMWGRPLVERYSDVLEFVGLCDVNPLRLEAARKAIGVDCPYLRDGCVFKEDVDAPDTMNAIVRYSSGATMSYSVNAFMPIEGYHLAFNGTEGRLEVRDFERQPWPVPEETEMHVVRNFGERRKVDLPRAEGGHGGGDDVLRDLIFRQVELPAYMGLPTSRAGAMSCLTGIAARKSMDAGRPVKIAELGAA
jgi:predicted dehydrogenase